LYQNFIQNFTRGFKFKAQCLLVVKAKFKFKLYCGARAEFSLRGILNFIRARISERAELAVLDKI